MKLPMMNQDGEKGAVLLVTMMILLILTLLGVAAISTTTSEIRIAGNAKFQNMVFYGADGGGRAYVPILNAAIQSRTLATGAPVMDANLLNEIMGMFPNDGATDDAVSAPDLSFAAGNVSVGVDIDRIKERFLSGGATEFAGGYEGIGASSVSGGIGIYYKMDSVGQFGRSESEVSHVYIHHVQ